MLNNILPHRNRRFCYIFPTNKILVAPDSGDKSEACERTKVYGKWKRKNYKHIIITLEKRNDGLLCKHDVKRDVIKTKNKNRIMKEM